MMAAVYMRRGNVSAFGTDAFAEILQNETFAVLQKDARRDRSLDFTPYRYHYNQYSVNENGLPESHHWLLELLRWVIGYINQADIYVMMAFYLPSGELCSVGNPLFSEVQSDIAFAAQ